MNDENIETETEIETETRNLDDIQNDIIKYLVEYENAFNMKKHHFSKGIFVLKFDDNFYMKVLN